MKQTAARAIALALMIAASGCSDDFLTTTPPDEISDFWNESKDAVLAVNALYPNLWGSREVMRLDGTTDNAIPRQPATQLALFSGTHDSTDPYVLETWTDAYRGIRGANTVILNIDSIPVMEQALRERLRSEAYFMRAYHYNNLVNLFGDVPLVLEPLDLGEAELPRTPAQEVRSRVFADLELAIAGLPEEYGQSDYGRATRGAALALKARAALWAGMYDVAAQAAQAVMDLDIYCLHPDYRGLFTYAGEGSCEIILSRQQIKDQFSVNLFQAFGPASAQGQSNTIPTRSIVDAYYASDGLPIDESPLYDPANPYANRDPRLDASLLRPGAMFLGKEYNSNPNSPTQDKLGSSQRATSTGYNLLKYIDPTDEADRTNSGIDLILMRYADVLLTYAEAKIELGQLDQSVYDAINEVRARVDLPPVSTGKTQSELRDIVRRERRVELAFEGLRLFDIRRWGIAEDVFNGSTYGIDVVVDGVRQPYLFVAGERFFDPNRDYLWPIPQAEIDLNPDLPQNPGY